MLPRAHTACRPILRTMSFQRASRGTKAQALTVTPVGLGEGSEFGPGAAGPRNVRQAFASSAKGFTFGFALSGPSGDSGPSKLSA
jgi:hypothetical protein